MKLYPAAMQQKGEAYIDLVTGGSHGSREAGNFILYVATQLHVYVAVQLHMGLILEVYM